MDAGCCHSVRANRCEIETLSGRRESVVEGQLKFRGRVVRVPISQHSLSAYHDPSLQAPISSKLGGFVGLPQSTTTTSSSHPPRDHRRPPSRASLASRGSLFSLSTPSTFIRDAAAPLLADPTTPTTLCCCGQGTIAIKHRAAQPRSMWHLIWLLRAAERTRAAAEYSHDTPSSGSAKGTQKPCSTGESQRSQRRRWTCKIRRADQRHREAARG